MRLSQLARKLELSPTDLILFFEKNKIVKYNSPNNKIEEEDLPIALNHFKPEELVAEIGEETSNEPISLEIITDKKNDENMELSESYSTITDGESIKQDSLKDPVDKIEVIRMPKIKLEGVKVVGKIDLPDPVKKVKNENNGKSADQQKDMEGVSVKNIKNEYKKTNKRSPRQKSKRQNSRSVLSYEERLQREERRKIQEQQRAKKLKKDQKKNHYLKNVQSNITPATKKKKNKKSDELELEPIKNRPEYKNPIKKFWAWLNGEYDR